MDSHADKNRSAAALPSGEQRGTALNPTASSQIGDQRHDEVIFLDNVIVPDLSSDKKISLTRAADKVPWKIAGQ
jgi:hypothetical protein